MMRFGFIMNVGFLFTGKSMEIGSMESLWKLGDTEDK